MRVNQPMRVWTVIGVMAASALVTRSADAAYTDPSFFGQTGTTTQQWASFTSVSTATPATTSTNSAGVATYIDSTHATDGVFLTSTGHLYSFSGVVNPQISVPLPSTAADALYTVVLQTEVAGNPLATSSFSLTANGVTTAATSVVQTDAGSSGSAMGGGTYDYTATWSGLTLANATAFVLNYAASDTSSSQYSARVDTLATTAVPEPTAAGLVAVAGAGLLVRRRRRTVA